MPNTDVRATGRNPVEEVYELVRKKRALFLSDVAKELHVSVYTAKDLVDILVKEGRVVVRDKGIAKLVMPFEQEDEDGEADGKAVAIPPAGGVGTT